MKDFKGFSQRIREMSLVKMFGHLVQVPSNMLKAVGYVAASVLTFAAGCVAGVLTPILAVTLPLSVLAGLAVLGALMGTDVPILGVIGIAIGVICGLMSMGPIAQAVWTFMFTQTTRLFGHAGRFLKGAGASLRAAFTSLQAALNLVVRNISTLVKALYSGIRILFWNVMKVSMVILAAAWGLAALFAPGAFLMIKGAPIWSSVCSAILPHGFIGALISLGLGTILFSAIVGTVFVLLCLKPMLHYGGPCIDYIFKKSDLAWKDLKDCTRTSMGVDAQQAADSEGSKKLSVGSDLGTQQNMEHCSDQNADTVSNSGDSAVSAVEPLNASEFLGTVVSAEGIVFLDAAAVAVSDVREADSSVQSTDAVVLINESCVRSLTGGDSSVPEGDVLLAESVSSASM